MIRSLILDASRSPALTGRISHSRLAQKASWRFLPGEELDDALDAAALLWDERIPSLLTRLGEHVTTAGAADDAARHYLGAIAALTARGLPGDVSVKPSQLGLAVTGAGCEHHLRAIAHRARLAGRVAWIDMEDSTTTDATLMLFERLSQSYQNLGLALQANLRRTPADLERLVPLRPRIRLVKGAYGEPPEIAYQGRKAIDAAYLELAGELISWAAAGRAEPVFGTHDTELIDRIAEVSDAIGAGRHAYEVHMLFGIRAEELRRLHREGTRVRVLISYGPDWAAWYLRRLAERPANVFLAASTLLRRRDGGSRQLAKRRS